jgi:hypothetical protein
MGLILIAWMCFFLYVIVTSTCMFIYTVYTCVGEDFKFTKNVSDLYVIECDYILCLKLNYKSTI